MSELEGAYIKQGHPTQFLVDQLTLSHQGGKNYAHQITTCPPHGF